MRINSEESDVIAALLLSATPFWGGPIALKPAAASLENFGCSALHRARSTRVQWQLIALPGMLWQAHVQQSTGPLQSGREKPSAKRDPSSESAGIDCGYKLSWNVLPGFRLCL